MLTITDAQLSSSGTEGEEMKILNWLLKSLIHPTLKEIDYKSRWCLKPGDDDSRKENTPKFCMI